jgi:5-methylcytosine-specific restriction endonuclease McrA
MSWGKIKLRRADILWSKYVRTEAGWKCQNCGKQCDPSGSPRLECAHYFGRRNESVRFDPENTFALCSSCHRHFHDEKQDHTTFMIKKIGQARFDALAIRANTPMVGTKEAQDQEIILFCKNYFAKIK